MEKLWLKLRRHESPTTRVSYFPWDAPWSGIAEHFLRTGPEDDFTTLEVGVFAYSWGVGNGFITLAHELRDRGMKIASAVLSDGVYHSGWFPWRALWSPLWKPVIVVPDNVRTVRWFRQKEEVLRGHDVVAKDRDATRIHRPTTLTIRHSYMDDHPEFHRQCEQVASTM